MYDLMVKTLLTLTITRGRKGRRFRFGVICRSYGDWVWHFYLALHVTVHGIDA
jgi:hypothetical protein